MSGIHTLRSEFELVQHLELLPLVAPAAMMELVCELFFSKMRVHNPMPTQVEYSDRHATVCLEARKKRGDRTWHYFTGKSSTYYPIAAVGSMSVSWFNRRKVSRLRLVPDGNEWLEVQEQRGEMVAFQHEYGAGVKQSTVRSAHTKFKAGTLPLSVSYRATNEAVQTDMPFINQVAEPPESNSGVGEVVAELKHRAGAFVAVNPSKKEAIEYASGDIWFGQLLEDVVYLNGMEPKTVGSKKLKKVSKALKPCLVIRWMEPADGFSGPGVLYEWYPAPGNQEPQATDIDRDCFTNCILCKVSITIEADAELGFDRFRVTQEESNRVKAIATRESSSEDDDSSDGVDEEFQVDVAQPSVEIISAAHNNCHATQQHQ